ncbi:hypothetical protein HDV05_002474 [Chytridiales sp. JEL 0842]|nr:hypothetical protein HDV05_002474 [Chytridiales sp. JEL 0842]
MLDTLRLDNRLQAFVTRYVWDLASDAQKREEVLRIVQRGKPFVETEYMAIAMIDVSGYSTITADLTQIGKVASEIISSTVNSYVKTILSVIKLYAGDVVKFLGDAVLVSFSATKPGESQRQIADRAVACCLKILKKHSVIRIDLNNQPFDFTTLSRAGTTMNHTYQSRGVKTEGSHLGYNSDNNELCLGVHLAVTTGSVDRRIFGIESSRLDYNLAGDCFGILGMLLDSTDPGEIGIAAEVVEGMYGSIKDGLKGLGKRGEGDKFLILESEAVNEATDFFLRYYNTDYNSGGELKSLVELNVEECGGTPVEQDQQVLQFVAKFVNKSLLYKTFPSTDAEFQSSIIKVDRDASTMEVEDTRSVNINDSATERIQEGDGYLCLASAWDGPANSKQSDVVNLAARLLSISYKQEQIVCDQQTYEAAKEDIRMTDLGEFKVKGKAERVTVYGLNKTTQSSEKRSSGLSKSVGYNAEKSIILQEYQDWKRGRGKWITIVEGPSGYGKSNMLEFATNIFEGDHIECCLTQASEIERWTPFFGLQALFQSVLKCFSGGLADQENARSSTTMGVENGWSRLRLRRRTSTSRVSIMDLKGQAHLKTVLTKIDEDPEYYPILLNVFGSGSLPDTSKTEGLDSQTRNALLKKFIIKMMQLLSQTQPIVYIFDDAQWLDPASLEILLQVVQEPSKVAILFLTRPIVDIEIDYMLKISKTPGIVHLNLKGLNQNESDELVVLKLEKYGVRTVESLLSKTIFEHTQGHPLKVDMTIGALFSESDSSCLEVSSTGELRAKNLGSISESLTQIESSNAALVQFDRLDDTFKDFLRKASIIGQYFNTDAIASVFELNFVNDDDVKEWIQQMDKFGFLVSQEKDMANVGDYYFKHISVMKSIYDTQPYEERSRRHHRVAEFYERVAGDGQEMDALLPIIAYHYSKTTNMKKNFFYLESLGYMNFRKMHYRECQSTLELLCSYIDTMDANSSDVVDEIRKSDWIAHLVFVLANLKQMQKVVPLSLKALLATGITIPMDDKKKTGKAILRCAAQLAYNWMKTKGGMRPFKVKGKAVEYLAAGVTGHNKGESGKTSCGTVCVDCPKVRRVHTLCFKALTIVAFASGALPTSTTILIILNGLNADVKTGSMDSGEWVVTVMRAGHSFYPKAPGIANAFLEKGTTIEKQRNLYGKTCLAYISAATLYFTRGDFKKSKEFSEAALEYFATRSDLGNKLWAQTFICFNRAWIGDIEGSISVLEGLYDKSAFKISPVFAIFAIQFAARVPFLKGDLDQFQKSIDVFDFYMENLPKIPAILCYHAVGDAMKCYIAFHQGAYDDACKLLESATKHLTMAANIAYPTQDCIMTFAVLSWLILSCHDSSSNDPYPFDTKVFLAGCQTGLKQAGGIHKNAKVFLFKWAARLLNSAMLFVQGKKAKALKLLVERCERCDVAEEFEKVPLLRAYVHGIVGKFLEGPPSQKKKFMDSSCKAFAMYDATFFLKWVRND